ncbi:DUF2514 family protein [Burkholderia sp. USMB20]|uniref:DUF2514 family protein n=1 Tax=Burkholderia sp. USMB20 TaxID=1571773 RepID=UPI0005CEE9CC|nr:DUF2514 family protein [Burkholderia sp. USMB20]TGN96136.1 DUF2514 family protein [Burkholderia sp. USMB20]
MKGFILTGIAACLVGALLGGSYVYEEKAREIESIKADAARAKADAVAAARNEEQRRTAAQAENAKDAEKQRTAAVGDAVAARATVDGLQRTVDQLVSRERARDSAATGDGAAGADPVVLLADVFGESVERNEALASALDRARIAGNECAADYDALTVSQ